MHAMIARLQSNPDMKDQFENFSALFLIPSHNPRCSHYISKIYYTSLAILVASCKPGPRQELTTVPKTPCSAAALSRPHLQFKQASVLSSQHLYLDQGDPLRISESNLANNELRHSATF